MNTLFLTLLYHPHDAEATARLSRDGLQNQINTYQWAFVDGLRQNLQAGETLQIVNALPVGVFPLRYRRLWLGGKTREGGAFCELASLNLPWCKQRMRARAAYRAMRRWALASPDNRNILVYSLYLPYMQAVRRLKRAFPDVKATVIVTDLPNELGIASGRRGLLKALEYRMGAKRTALCSAFDSFVLLTAPMAEALPIQGKARMVLEGLVSENPLLPQADETLPNDPRPAVLYTGTLNRELGIDILLEAFAAMPAVALWLCGRGDMQREVAQAAQQHPNIRYFGQVPQQTALAMQARVAALINPRTAQGAFTRYSFPSKTLEYMRSGKPVLCCKLEGIPAEYDPYLTYIEPQTAAGIRAAVEALLARPEAERAAMGERARDFVLREKNARAQCGRLTVFLRGLHGGS
jgi:glycosyltransferase involved in cell wall biosynthesis